MFKDNFKIVVKDLLDKDYAHTPEDAQKIIDYILKNHEEKNVTIDFKGIDTANTAFCNILYEDLKIENRTWTVTLVNCNELILETFNRVKDNYNKREFNSDLLKNSKE